MIQKDNLVQRLISKSQERNSVFATDLDEIRYLLSEAADELMHQQNETLRWKAECFGVWQESEAQRVERLAPVGGYKKLAKKNNSLAEEVATLRKQLAEVSRKLEDYRDLDSLLCK